jgi:hypothetical protein
VISYRGCVRKHGAIVSLLCRVSVVPKVNCWCVTPFESAATEPTPGRALYDQRHLQRRAGKSTRSHTLTDLSVVQIRFVEWTAQGRLRHAAFLGMRDDKAAEDVRRESELASRGLRCSQSLAGVTKVTPYPGLSMTFTTAGETWGRSTSTHGSHRDGVPPLHRAGSELEIVSNK